MTTRVKALVLALLLGAAAAAQSGVEPGQAREIFSEIGGILQDLHEITGFKIKHQVPAEMITRDKVKEFLEKRMKEASARRSPRRGTDPQEIWPGAAGFRPGQEHR